MALSHLLEDRLSCHVPGRITGLCQDFGWSVVECCYIDVQGARSPGHHARCIVLQLSWIPALLLPPYLTHQKILLILPLKFISSAFLSSSTQVTPCPIISITHTRLSSYNPFSTLQPEEFFKNANLITVHSGLQKVSAFIHQIKLTLNHGLQNLTSGP